MKRSRGFFKIPATNEGPAGDTHIALWAITDDPALPLEAKSLILDPGNIVFVSAANLWEITIKHAIKPKLMPISGSRALLLFRGSGYWFLDISPWHATKVEELPPFHQDPFDRMLVAQAISEPLVLLTHDRQVARYGESIILF